MEHSLEKKGRKSATDTAAVVTETPVAHPVVPEEKPVEAKAEVKYEDLRSLLAEKSAAGYRTQVIALIRSYGAEKLSAFFGDYLVSNYDLTDYREVPEVAAVYAEKIEFYDFMKEDQLSEIEQYGQLVNYGAAAIEN